MDLQQYYVVHDGGGWRIQCNGENSEPFGSRQDAIRSAVDLAHLDELNGREAQVVAQGEDAMFRRQWRSAIDPYPPG